MTPGSRDLVSITIKLPAQRLEDIDRERGEYSREDYIKAAVALRLLKADAIRNA